MCFDILLKVPWFVAGALSVECNSKRLINDDNNVLFKKIRIKNSFNIKQLTCCVHGIDVFLYNNIVNIVNVPSHGFALQIAVMDAQTIPPQYLVLTMVPFPQDLVHSDHSAHAVEKHCKMYVRQWGNNIPHLLIRIIFIVTHKPNVKTLKQRVVKTSYFFETPTVIVTCIERMNLQLHLKPLSDQFISRRKT